MSTLLQVSIMYNVTFLIIHITWRGACLPIYRAVYRALDKTVSQYTRREDLTDTLSLPREYSLSENLT